MRPLTVIRALGPIDARSVARDSLLAWFVFVPLVIGLMLRWLLPRLTAWSAAEFDFALEPYHPLIVSYFLTAPVSKKTILKKSAAWPMSVSPAPDKT